MYSARFLVLAFLLCVFVAHAIPPQINYQGFLADPSGAALDTTVAMTFSLIDPSSMNPLWEETHPEVVVSKGLFSVLLGSIVPIPTGVLLVSLDTNALLSVRVGSDSEMTPLSEVASVPYARCTGTVEYAWGGLIRSSLTVTGKVESDSLVTRSYLRFNDGTIQTTAAGGSGGQQYADTSTFDATRSWVNNQLGPYTQDSDTNAWLATKTDLDPLQANADSNTWDATKTWVRSGGYLRGTNNVVSSAGFVGGGDYNMARGDYAVVVGGGGLSQADSNSAMGDYSAIAGGRHNVATGTETAVSGGNYNSASGGRSTVSGGEHNTASSEGATVGGGYYNTASNDATTVGGGGHNSASGAYSTVAGGYLNDATGWYSFAAGYRAKANHGGAFVWADSYNNDFASSTANQFNVRASGGVRIYSNSGLTAGVTLAAGASAWAAVSDSTQKRNLRLVDTREVLNKVSQLPIKQWSYKTQDPSIEHIGPMAQDFWNLFQIGDDSLSISTIDPSGIALAAIQELAKENEELRTAVRRYRDEMNELLARVQTLEADKQETSNRGR